MMQLVQIEHARFPSGAHAVFEVNAVTSSGSLEVQGFAKVEMIGSGFGGGKATVFDREGRLIGQVPVSPTDGSATTLRVVAISVLRAVLPDEDIG